MLMYTLWWSWWCVRKELEIWGRWGTVKRLVLSIDCGAKELWSWGTKGRSQNHKKWDAWNSNVWGFFFGFFLPLLEQKLVINLTVLRTIHFLLQAKKRNLRQVISLVTQSNNVIQSGNQYYRYWRPSTLCS